MLSHNREICITYCTELNQEIAIFSLDKSVASGTYSYKRHRKQNAMTDKAFFIPVKGRSAEFSVRIGYS